MTTENDRLITELARRHSAGLLDDAVRQARARVQDELARRLEAAMLAAALSERDSGRHTAPSTRDPEVGLYVYGFTRADTLDLTEVSGVDDQRPRLITGQGLGLIVSDVRLGELAALEGGEPTEHSRLAEFARRHDAVIRAAFDQAALLPLRFGTVLPDAAAANTLLDERGPDAVTLLDRIAGKREWGAKVMPAAEPVADSPERAKARSGTEFLAHKRSELEQRRATVTRRRAVVDDAHATLAGLSADSRYRAGTDGVLLDGAYLVADTHTDDFLAGLDKLGGELAEHGLTLRATGPWPPYSFAALPELTSA